MKFPAWYGILVGSLMIVQWTFSIVMALSIHLSK